MIKKDIQLYKQNDTSKYPDIKLVFSKENRFFYINNDLLKDLISVKNKIDKSRDWDKIKKIINTFERVYIPNSESVAKYKPISRAYFKLWETLYDYPNLGHNLNRKLVSLHLAEGPGGFIEALHNYRKKMYQFSDMMYAATLPPSESKIPGWKNKINQNNVNMTLVYGDICTDDYYKNVKKNMDYQKADLITADGAFDCSDNFNKQERISVKLIYCEIVIALATQRIGGSFIFKIFDTFETITIKLLYMLNLFYKNVYITKPLTSREGNSEKYVIAEEFKGISQEYLDKMNDVISLWNNTDESENLLDIFDYDLMDYQINQITDLNKYIIGKQISSLNRGIKIMQDGIDTSTIKIIEQRQRQMAVMWCQKYGVEHYTNRSY